MKKKRTRNSLLILVLLALIGANPLFAAWSEDPASPTPISVVENAKLWPQLTATSDGYVVAWLDERRELYDYRDLYAQKFTVDGEMLWTSDGRVIAEGPANALLGYAQAYQSLVSDNEGGAIIHWTDVFGTYGNAFITQIAADENVQWGMPGVGIQLGDTAVQIGSDGTTVTKQLVQDTEGGVFSLFTLGNAVPSIQRFSSLGEARSNVWQTGLSDTRWLSMVQAGEQEGKNSVILAYVHGLEPSINITKLTDPELDWPVNLDDLELEWAVEINATEVPFNFDSFEIISDNSGGAFIAWVENYDLFLIQKINSDGSFAWTVPGVVVSTLEGWDRFTRIAPDGSGGVVVVWEYREAPIGGPIEGVYAQRIDSTGTAQWGEDGILISSDGRSPQAILSSEGNYIVVYNQPLYDLVAQKLAGDGTFLWEGGKLLSTTFMLSDWEKAFDIASDNHGGVIAVFTARVGTDGVDKIYGTRIYEELPDLPDLTINKVTASSYWWDSKQITARVTVANTGTVDIPEGESCQVSLYLDNVNTPPVATEILNGGLAVNDTNILRMQFSAPSMGEIGSYNLVVVVDSDEQINEENEENNVYNKVIRY